MSKTKLLIAKLLFVLWLGWVGALPISASERWGGPTSIVDQLIEAVGTWWAGWQLQSADPADPIDPPDPPDPIDLIDPIDPTDPGTGGDATIGVGIDPRG